MKFSVQVNSYRFSKSIFSHENYTVDMYFPYVEIISVEPQNVVLRFSSETCLAYIFPRL